MSVVSTYQCHSPTYPLPHHPDTRTYVHACTHFHLALLSRVHQQEELLNGSRELLPLIGRIQRQIKGSDATRGDIFVLPSSGQPGPLIDVLVAAAPTSNVVLPTLQAIAAVTRQSKTASKLARRGAGSYMIKVRLEGGRVSECG